MINETSNKNSTLPNLDKFVIETLVQKSTQWITKFQIERVLIERVLITKLLGKRVLFL